MRMLYIEDDETLAQVTSIALKKRGFNVDLYTSLHAFEQSDNEGGYTHALLDLRLDDGQSLSIIPELVESHPGIKILMLTAYASVATAVKAVKLGAVNYLAKPATVDQILTAIEDDTISDSESDQDVDAVESEEKISLKRIEWEHIQQVLAENNGNITNTAKQLKMHRRTLQRKLKKRPSIS